MTIYLIALTIAALLSAGGVGIIDQDWKRSIYVFIMTIGFGLFFYLIIFLSNAATDAATGLGQLNWPIPYPFV